MAYGPERDRFDGTKGFVQALVVCCGADTTFTGSDFLFCIVFGIEFLAVSFGSCLVLTFIGSSMVVVCGVDDYSEKGRFSTSCMVSVAHAFAME